MSDTGRKVSLTIGVVVLALGLLGPFGPAGIGFGIGLIVASQKKNTEKAKTISRKPKAAQKRPMTREENDLLISAILPTINKDK